MKKCLVEFIGTFFLVLTIVLTVLGGLGNMAPVAIGSMLMVMVYAGGHVSGSHYNPAVTVAVWIRGKCATSEVIPYIFSQLIASVVAAFTAKYLLSATFPDLNPVVPELAILPAILAEFIGTFALCYVVLSTATVEKNAKNSYFGLAIGFTVLACAYSLGGFSGGAFNPAVFVGISTAGMQEFSNVWIFFIGELSAAIVAGFVFKFVNGDIINIE